MGPEHAAALAEIEAQCLYPPWTAQNFTIAFENTRFAAFGVWETSADSTSELVGYITIYHVVDELQILNLGVRADKRHQGIGRQLLQNVLQEGKKLGMLKAVLDVRVSNMPAIQLYKSLGFTPLGVRMAYYQDNGENALLLVLDL